MAWLGSLASVLIKCTECDSEKPEGDFSLRTDTGKKRGQCKNCRGSYFKIKNNEYHQSHKEEKKIKRKEKYNSPKGRYKGYKDSAKQKGFEFKLTFEEFVTFWQQPCYYCKVPIDLIGIDRVNNSKGYSLENCVSCCFNCNSAKNKVSIEICRKVIEFIDKNL